ncbi:hypothetical protein EVAR_58032_1 [Eumeta japonica]|uniref:Uncharacterized protein n=1 Tax=Eumeta variegata TaxID=151549 RepID=A0A4C1ZM18_EUMVA|nr:hypothetical protein EVAR_58032_1 [Eumeta japonica]
MEGRERNKPPELYLLDEMQQRKLVNSPFLVVELSLTRLEGTQLRALGLLSVFGFNVTYAVRGPGEPAPSSCSAVECRLLGHCYATHDYQIVQYAMFILLKEPQRKRYRPLVGARAFHGDGSRSKSKYDNQGGGRGIPTSFEI